MSENYGSGYNWNDREDPCVNRHTTEEIDFYREMSWLQTWVSSQKKDADGHMTTAITDLRSVSPISDVSLSFYDFQQQLIFRRQEQMTRDYQEKYWTRVHPLLLPNIMKAMVI